MAAQGSALAELFECSLCFESYDTLDRIPKIMGCFHTYCLDCLIRHVKTSGKKTCPKCRQAFSAEPSVLTDNFTIMGALDARGLKVPTAPTEQSLFTTEPEVVAAISQRYFCNPCNRDASDRCLMNMHDVVDKTGQTGMVMKLANKAKEQAKRQFEREGGVLKDLAESLEAFSNATTRKGGVGPRVERELREVKKQHQVLDKMSKMVMEVPLSAFQDNGDVPRALEKFLQANSERLFALEEQKRMLEMAKRCTVTVRSEGTGLAMGISKTLSIVSASSAEDHVLSYLIYLLLHGQEAGAGTEAVDGAASSSPAVPSLETLIADVKKFIIDGDEGEDKDDNDSDDESNSDTSSVASAEVSTLPDNCTSAKKVFVGRIPIVARPEEIKELFSRFGKILYVRFMTRPQKEKAAPSNGPKFHCALVYVLDDATLENILRNRPIAFKNNGNFGRCWLNVQEDNNTGKHHGGDGKQQRNQRRLTKKNGGPAAPKKSSEGNQENEAARKVFANQVPLDSTESDLANFFSKYGAVQDVLRRVYGVGQKPMAFITFKDVKSVARVFAARPIIFNGFDLQVQEIHAKTPRAQQLITPNTGVSNSQLNSTDAQQQPRKQQQGLKWQPIPNKQNQQQLPQLNKQKEQEHLQQCQQQQLQQHQHLKEKQPQQLKEKQPQQLKDKQPQQLKDKQPQQLKDKQPQQLKDKQPQQPKEQQPQEQFQRQQQEQFQRQREEFLRQQEVQFLRQQQEQIQRQQQEQLRQQQEQMQRQQQEQLRQQQEQLKRQQQEQERKHQEQLERKEQELLQCQRQVQLQRQKRQFEHQLQLKFERRERMLEEQTSQLVQQTLENQKVEYNLKNSIQQRQPKSNNNCCVM